MLAHSRTGFEARRQRRTARDDTHDAESFSPHSLSRHDAVSQLDVERLP
jgi:hypothetical protein